MPSRFAPLPGGGLSGAPPPRFSVWDECVQRSAFQSALEVRAVQAAYESLRSAVGSDADAVLDNVLRGFTEFTNPKTTGQKLVPAPHQRGFLHAMVRFLFFILFFLFFTEYKNKYVF